MADKQYLDLARHVLENGVAKSDRTGTGTLSTFGYQMRFDLRKGFPLLTTKHVNFNAVKGEMLAFVHGETNANVIAEKYGFGIWRKWADKTGELGPIYGKQWREWDGYDEHCYTPNTFDQIAQVIAEIKRNPDSRRLLVSAWNVGELDQMALPPCHFAFQFYVSNGKLSCMLYQRSADVFLGVPFNIAGYALLTHMIAQVTDLEVGELIHTIGDAHIYNDHVVQINTQLTREPRELPKLWLNSRIDDIDDFELSDIDIVGYKPHGKITGNVSV